MTSSIPATTIWNAITGADPSATRHWLHWHPSELGACVQARGAAMPAPLIPEELDSLNAAHVRWGADNSTISSIQRLGTPRARVVVAGQQPGLLGGPLYTIYKALGAVKLAGELQSRHPGLEFIPVFWVASEDHDYEEVAGAVWPQAAGELTEFRFAHPDWTPGRMVGSLPAAPLIEPLIQAIVEGSHETEFRPDLIQSLRSFGSSDADEPATWEDLFCRLLLRLVRGTGLVIVSPLMPWVRRRAAAILKQEIAAAGESTRLILERSAEAARRGLPTPLHRGADAVNFFHVDANQRRRPVRLVDRRLVCNQLAPASNEHADAEVSGPGQAWVERLESHPESFSTNVVTRPLVQDSILPTVAQLVGPGEAAYFAQVEAVYQRFGVFAPVRYPRPQALLVERAVERTLQKLNLSPRQVAANDVDTLVRTLQESAEEDAFAGHLSALRDRQRQEVMDLKSRLGKGGAADSAVDKLAVALDRGYDAVMERYRDDRRRQEPQLEASVRKLRANLAPRDLPQERVFNPLVPFAVKYGLDWPEGFLRQLRIGHEEGLQLCTPGS